MIVFKTFLKILNKNKLIVILLTVMLIAFGGFNTQSNDNTASFVASKPDIQIINKDEDNKITNNLVKYISDNSNIMTLDTKEDKLNDALFYRDVSYIIYIPENYGNDFLAGKNPTIDVKSTGDYESSLATMMLERYLKVANIYSKSLSNPEELTTKINETLDKEAEIEITTKLDTNALSKATTYYNFANYSIIACLVYVICLILSSFKNIKIQKRTIISSMDYKKINRQLLLSNCLFAILLWIIYVALSFLLAGKVMFSTQGLFYIVNSLIFTLFSTTMACFIGALVNNREAINGIVNVVSLGSSFLCGAFVPTEWLADSVLKIAHILPSYYYINTNETIKTLETISIDTLKPIIINTIALIAFAVVFIIITNIVSRRKRKIG